MKRKIKSVSELPDWLKNRYYEKKLTKINWYREIRLRQKLLALLELSRRIERPLGELSDKSKELHVKLLQTKPPPDSLIFHINQSARPVWDLTAWEALYFRSAIRDDELRGHGKKLDELLSLWFEVLEEDPAARISGFGNYEDQIRLFFDELEKTANVDKLDEPIDKFLEGLGNPWLSYERPINGFPITVDTQYDDETIISHFKQWLANKRKTEGERARRPFLQNDFDDWEYFKIREIFDLETWAKIMNVKIPDNVIAHFLWPNSSDDFSPIDVLRTTARKKVKDVFNYGVIVRLYGQLLLEYGENFLEE